VKCLSSPGAARSSVAADSTSVNDDGETGGHYILKLCVAASLPLAASLAPRAPSSIYTAQSECQRERSNLPSVKMKCEGRTQRTSNPEIASPEVSEVFGP
jgi:hypothetical protein